jgi:histidine triad (HIT) family protein
MSCIFCSIVANQAPSFKVYEDDLVIAILIPRPIRPGHCIIITKSHYVNFIDLPDDLAQHVSVVGNKIGRKIFSELKPKKVGIVVSGFGVPHFHYHVIPLEDEQDISSSAYVSVQDGKLIFATEFCPEATKEELTAVSHAIHLKE